MFAHYSMTDAVPLAANLVGSLKVTFISFIAAAAAKCVSYDNIQKGLKLSLPQSHSSANAEQSDINGATDLSTQNNIGKRHALSTGCLLSSNTTTEYHTSAKLNDHFPQKTLTPSSGSSIRRPPSVSITSGTTGGSCEGRAPVASLDEPDSPSLERRGSESTEENDSQRKVSCTPSVSTESDSTNSQVSRSQCTKYVYKCIHIISYRRAIIRIVLLWKLVCQSEVGMRATSGGNQL